MKNGIINLIFLFVVFCVNAQTVNCDLTLKTTIEGFNVYKHNPSGAIMYKAKMYIDADGSPRAYGPNNSGLDYTANAGSPGNWWGIVTDGSGNPVIQGASDPYPGMYVSTTSLVNSAYSSSNPLRYTNSETVPFFVLPTAVTSLGGISIGDIGYVYNTVTGLGCYAIYADSGPAGKLGEGSMFLADQIGIGSNPKTGGTSLGIIEYIIFPQSGAGQGTIPSISQINSIGTSHINSVGGIGIAGCLDNPINNPANLLATPSACPLNEVVFSWANTGSNWHIDISTTTDFANYFIKYISTVTTYTGPTGFVDHANGTTALIFQAGVTYHWRITNSNGSVAGPDFLMNLCDNIAPVCTVNTGTGWITSNFTATFSDIDNSGGSGIDKAFYQVLDFDGHNWGANTGKGFFADNFDTLKSSIWTNVAGTWISKNGNLFQSDSTLSNTNIYSSLNQNLSNQYLYQYTSRLESAPMGSNNRRFGFHFFCDSANTTNRSNSYFIFFRQETSKLEFYKVVNNVYSQTKVVDNIATNIGQWYDVKIIFDKSSGKISVYRDDVIIGSWTDATPLTNQGNYVSFRTGNCKVSFGELKIFRSRGSSVSVTVGLSGSDIRFQNPNPSVVGAKIKSVATDIAGNISAIASSDLNVDWTAPVSVLVNDGTAADIDVSSSTTQLSANWTTSSDLNSGIAEYFYAIGTTTGGTNILGWTSNVSNISVTKTGLNLIAGTTYYVSVKSKNGASIESAISTTDGVLVSSGGFTVSGNLTYNNSVNTPMANVSLTLYNGVTQVATTITNASGNFTFSGIPNGTYTVSGTTASLWGGATATDVLKIKRHIAGLELLTEPIRLTAADVNSTSTINATDVLKLQRRLAGLENSFTRADWLLEKPYLGGSSIVINNSNISVDLYMLCTGDVNGSNMDVMMETEY